MKKHKTFLLLASKSHFPSLTSGWAFQHQAVFFKWARVHEKNRVENANWSNASRVLVNTLQPRTYYEGDCIKLSWCLAGVIMHFHLRIYKRRIITKQPYSFSYLISSKSNFQWSSVCNYCIISKKRVCEPVMYAREVEFSCFKLLLTSIVLKYSVSKFSINIWKYQISEF
jgi:hypothetical protein